MKRDLQIKLIGRERLVAHLLTQEKEELASQLLDHLSRKEIEDLIKKVLEEED